MATKTKAQVEAELKAALTTISEFDKFKRKVVDVAQDYAEREGWCDAVDEALTEIGLEHLLKSTKRKVTLTVEVEVDAEERGFSDDDYRQLAEDTALVSSWNTDYTVVSHKVEELAK